MEQQAPTTILRGGRVIDPAQGIDRVADVAIGGGRILAVGDVPPAPGAEEINVAGQMVSPGWIDIHVHVYGTLGFADPDSIGVAQGVTTYVEAGGPGIDTLDEFVALLGGQTRTALHAGPYVRPTGIVGLNFIERDPRSLRNFPLAKWMDFVAAHPGLVRYLKVGAFGGYGVGPLRISKGLAESIDVPLYVHIGEHQLQREEAASFEIFRIADAGDIVTHLYHNNGARLLDADWRLRPIVREAQRRGVLFDIGFGGYNFAWSVAEKGFAQDFVPDTISSDLQQFNVAGPTYSLANVMSIMLRLGLSVPEVISRVTDRAARAIKLDDRAGTLRPGMPADITVFTLESGQFELADTYGDSRLAERRFLPLMTFKDGERIAVDMTRCQDENNWLMQVIEDRVPAGAAALTERQRDFLAALRRALTAIAWDEAMVKDFNLDRAILLQDTFHAVRAAAGLPLRDALRAVYDCFLERAFTMQIGLFLLRLDRDLALQRLAEVAPERRRAA